MSLELAMAQVVLVLVGAIRQMVVLNVDVADHRVVVNSDHYHDSDHDNRRMSFGCRLISEDYARFQIK